ncbi:tetraacyldisaccharide 4'-kinase [Pseudozobellia thermophila]|uniref:Tetraacyldisaccharide 4'-kinase n=1 Tax=Pseudozobellia thermophila TaxID=192903 RepID=A0A1M6JVZ8_9FLAO|nr:tetraacyldisaccharide 4'-kinase [Pseudozobellia thermophila]SHJ50864.1 lipid-A-disaccharide kinase [Pseudozobellia thermophila]
MQILRKLLYPVSLVYGLVVRLRNYLYDIGFLKSRSFKTPTVCVGNLSVGGTGKTPMIEFLIANLRHDFDIAVLSRGYRRKSKGFLLADGTGTALTLGDEPFQVYSKFRDITVAVDADRQNGISILEKEVGPDLILLDDAFQHRKVKCSFYLLLTAFDKLYVDDTYLPTGNLRDSRKEADRADIIVVTKCPSSLSEGERDRIARKLGPKAHQEVLFSFLSYDETIAGPDGPCSLDDLRDRKVTLVTGIAEPSPLVGYLRGQGLAFEHLAYKDHHFFSTGELDELGKKDVVLTTEKDYVRLKDSLPGLYRIAVKHVFYDQSEGRLLRALKDIR